MQSFTIGKVNKFIIHFIGNKNNGEGVRLSDDLTDFEDIEEQIRALINNNFKTEELYQFFFLPSLELNPIFQFIKSIFQDKGLTFGAKSKVETSIPAEIVVVDNNSTDDTIQKLSKYKQVKVLKNTANLGFGPANNQGLKESRGEYILFLNSDTIINNSAISQSLTYFCTHPELACLTTQLLNSDGSVQECGGYFPNLLNTFTWCSHMDDLPWINKIIPAIHPHTPNFYLHDDFYQHDQYLDWIKGAYFLTRKTILNKVGGFDPQIFMYAEDIDLSYRIKKAYPGLKNYLYSTAKVTHLGGGSSKFSNLKLNKEREGVKYFFQKHQPQYLPLIKIFLVINQILGIFFQ